MAAAEAKSVFDALVSSGEAEGGGGGAGGAVAGGGGGAEEGGGAPAWLGVSSLIA